MSLQQAQLQAGTQIQHQQHIIQHQPQQIIQQAPPPKPPTPTIHSTNPAINALVTNLMNSANQFQQEAAGKFFYSLLIHWNNFEAKKEVGPSEQNKSSNRFRFFKSEVGLQFVTELSYVNFWHLLVGFNLTELNLIKIKDFGKGLEHFHLLLDFSFKRIVFGTLRDWKMLNFVSPNEAKPYSWHVSENETKVHGILIYIGSSSFFFCRFVFFPERIRLFSSMDSSSFLFNGLVFFLKSVPLHQSSPILIMTDVLFCFNKFVFFSFE